MNDALVERFVLREWFEGEEAFYAAKIVQILEATEKHVPPCVSMAYNKTLFNGWATSARGQHCDKVCLLCWECEGHDRLEHYAACTYHWEVYGERFKRPLINRVPNTLVEFLGLKSFDLDEIITRMVHVYAVYSAYNSRKHAGKISGPDDMDDLIWSGHRTAQLVHSGLCNRYRNLYKRNFPEAESSSDSSSSTTSTGSSSDVDN